MIDVVLERMKMCKAILIVCDDKEPICDFVNKELDRGATYTPATVHTPTSRATLSIPP